MLRIVADIGNSRLKWARLDERGAPAETVALPLDDSDAWAKVYDDWHSNMDVFPLEGRRQTPKASDEGDAQRGTENEPSNSHPTPVAPSSGPSGHLPPPGGKAVRDVFPPGGGRQTPKASDEGDNRRGIEDDPSGAGPTPVVPLIRPFGPPSPARGEGREAESSVFWAVSSVNPPLARQLADFLAAREPKPADVRWFLTAAEVPVAKDVEGAETGGSDRALAVLGAIRLLGTGRSILVVSCGTAITIERVTADGVWQGGAIAMGLGLCARALHHFTAQLPLVSPDGSAPSWGRSTTPSLEAGVFWGTVGSVRELLERQEPDMQGRPLVVWTGGDASLLAEAVEGSSARVVPDLVLHGLIHAAFPSDST